MMATFTKLKTSKRLRCGLLLTWLLSVSPLAAQEMEMPANYRRSNPISESRVGIS